MYILITETQPFLPSERWTLAVSVGHLHFPLEQAVALVRLALPDLFAALQAPGPVRHLRAPTHAWRFAPLREHSAYMCMCESC